MIALVAIVVRGVAFALRTEAAGGDPAVANRLGRAFGAASVVAPLLFGASAAAVAQVSSAGPPSATPVSAPWTGLFAGLVGLLAVALCAHLAASFMTSRLAQTEDLSLAQRFRLRGLQTGTAMLVLSVLALSTAAWKAPALWHRLSTTALPLLVIGLVATLASVVALATRRFLVARVTTMVAVCAVLWGWLIAQAPRLIGARLTIHTAAATTPELTALAIAAAVVLLTVIPAFYLLYALFAYQSPEATE
jgi:cytochrome bd ubiquinol oxidase subunit II